MSIMIGLLATVFTVAGPGAAKDSTSTAVAVFDFTPQQEISQAETDSLTQLLVQALSRQGSYSVIPSDSVHRARALYSLEEGACADSSCTPALARYIGVRYIIQGMATRVGRAGGVKVTVTDSTSGAAPQVLSVLFGADSLGVTGFFANLAGVLAPAHAVATTALPDTQRAVAPAKEMGGVVLIARPDSVTVTLNDSLVGKTPLKLTSLPPGKHTMRLSADGYFAYENEIEVVAGVTRVYEAKLRKRNRLRIFASEPGAFVYLNGHRVGEVPYGIDLPAGTKLHVSVSKPGYNVWEKQIEIAAPTRINATLPKKGSRRKWLYLGSGALASAAVAYAILNQPEPTPTASPTGLPTPPGRPQ